MACISLVMRCILVIWPADFFFIPRLGMVRLSVFVHYTMPNRITQCANYICVARNYNDDSLNVVEVL